MKSVEGGFLVLVGARNFNVIHHKIRHHRLAGPQAAAAEETHPHVFIMENTVNHRRGTRESGKNGRFTDTQGGDKMCLLRFYLSQHQQSPTHPPVMASPALASPVPPRCRQETWEVRTKNLCG